VSSASALRRQIEASLADRIPSALTPAQRTLRPVASTGIQSVDDLTEGGFPLGAITEMVGSESSGRTACALSFVAQRTASGKVCAWVDVSNTLDPASAAAAGVDLSRLLWIRCGIQPLNEQPRAQAPRFILPGKYLVPPGTPKGLHGGGHGSHPRDEVKGLPDAVRHFLEPQSEPRKNIAPKITLHEQPSEPASLTHRVPPRSSFHKPWHRIEQALRVTDLLLQAGGFSTIVLDMGSLAPEHATRVPLATWFRYRAAAETGQISILLLTQHACAKSSAGLVLRLHTSKAQGAETTVFTGPEYHVEVARQRFALAAGNVIPLRKPPQRAGASWQSRTPWAGPR